jgi:Protein of unknown function (DUF3085)
MTPTSEQRKDPTLGRDLKRGIDYRNRITAPPEAPAVLLVHDEGVYLMSNGAPLDIDEGECSFVACARGRDPKADSGWYDTARDLFGGDDFAECLPWAAEIKRQLDAGGQEIIIEISGDSLALAERS